MGRERGVFIRGRHRHDDGGCVGGRSVGHGPEGEGAIAEDPEEG